MPEKKTVVISMEQGPMFDDIFKPDIMADLEKYADVKLNDLGHRMSSDEFLAFSQDADAIITAWGSPYLDERFAQLSKLKIISHAAGSVKKFYVPEIWDAGIVVTNAGAAIAKYVGEFTLTLALAMLRTLPKYALGSPCDQWRQIPSVTNETLFGKTVGLIGLGYTARAFLDVLKPFGCKVLCYDPHILAWRAQELGVELVSLEEVMSKSRVISVHAPITEITKGMINADMFKLVQDGAVFINTARGILIDHDALAKELADGRFKAALDVTNPEPLPQDHPLMALPNVLITPHIAGPTTDGRRDLFQMVVDDLIMFWEGKEPRYRVTKEMLETMA